MGLSKGEKASQKQASTGIPGLVTFDKDLAWTVQRMKKAVYEAAAAEQAARQTQACRNRL